MKRTYPSGFSKRQRKKEEIKKRKRDSGALLKFFSVSHEEVATASTDEDCGSSAERFHDATASTDEAEACKRRWKNLRDRYLKEVRTEIKSKKQGEMVQSKWKYRQLMNFIAPFTGSRFGSTDVCSNPEDDHDSPDNVTGSAEQETTLSDSVKMPQNASKVEVSLPEPKAQVAFVTQLPALSQDTQVAQLAQLAVVARTPPGPQIFPTSNTGQKRKIMSEPSSPSSPQSTHSPTKWLVKDNCASFASRPRDEDELFLLSFVPAMKRLAPQKRCETKMKIQQLMYEAEFNVSSAEFPEIRTVQGKQE